MSVRYEALLGLPAAVALAESSSPAMPSVELLRWCFPGFVFFSPKHDGTAAILDSVGMKTEVTAGTEGEDGDDDDDDDGDAEEVEDDEEDEEEEDGGGNDGRLSSSLVPDAETS